MESQDYAITLTGNKLLHKFDTDRQVDLLHDEFVRLFAPLGRVTSVVELTQNYDAHCHAIVRLRAPFPRDICIFIKNLFRKAKYIGYTCVKVVENYDGWIQYLNKDRHKTFKQLGRNPVLVDNFDCFPKGIEQYLHAEPN